MKMIVEAYEKGLRFRDGRFVEVLEPGPYRIARFLAKERIEKVDMRQRTLVLNGQEMMTLDKVTLRLTSLATLRVKDPVAARLKVDNYAAQLYSDVQLALRDHVGALELDALLAAKSRLGERILEEVKLVADGYGVEVLNVGLRDIVLPSGALKLPSSWNAPEPGSRLSSDASTACRFRRAARSASRTSATSPIGPAGDRAGRRALDRGGARGAATAGCGRA